MVTLSERELEIREEIVSRKLAKISFVDYIQYIDPRYQIACTQGTRNKHRELIDVLQDVAHGKLDRLILNTPPRLGKSELGGIKLPTYFIGQHPEKNFMLASYAKNLASNFTKKSRDIVTSQRYKNVFPDIRLALDQNTKNNRETIAPDGISRGGMLGVGVGGELTGLGGDLIYIDDPVKNMKEAQSPVTQEAIRDWFDSVASTRKQNENTAIVVTMTRWHVNDLAGKLKKKMKEGGERYYEFTVQAINEQDEPLIWPGKRGPEYFFKERATRSPKVWGALFQQNPLDAMGSMFKPGDEREFLESDFEKVGGWNKSDIVLGIFVDPAFSTSMKSCDAVVRVAGQHKITKDIFFFDLFADTSAPSVTRNQIFYMARKWQMRGYQKPFISIERANINKDQTKFIKDFYDDMAQRNEFYKVVMFDPPPDKLTRIKDEIDAMYSLNRLFFNLNIAPELHTRTLDQYWQFPFCDKVDIIDCDAQAIYQLTNGVGRVSQTDKEKKRTEDQILDPITGQPMEKVYIRQ